MTRITTRYDNNNQIITEVTEDYDKNEVKITIPLYYLFGLTEKPTQLPELEKGDYKIQIFALNTASTPISTIQIRANDMPFVLKFYHHDHLGTVRYITNESGEILHTTDTLAYGEELTAPYEDQNDKVLNTITYTGHEKDYETNLTYMLARYYSQGYGRFLSPDPGYDYDQLDPMSWNLYSYVRGNPIRFLDLTGMSLEEFVEIVNSSGIEYELQQHLDEKNEWGRPVIKINSFFSTKYKIDRPTSWEKRHENSFEPKYNPRHDTVLTAHTHPGKNPSFISVADVLHVMGNAIRTTEPSFKYGLVVSNKGSFGFEIDVSKIPAGDYTKLISVMTKENQDLTNKFVSEGMKFMEASMKATFQVLKKYNLLKAVHFYKKDKNGKWIEIDPTRYIEEPKGESK